jgi:hypothetical protein
MLPQARPSVPAYMPHQILLALRVRSQNTSRQSGHCRSRDQVPSARDGGRLDWAPYVTMETSLLQRVVPAPLLGWVFGARRALTAAAAPLGAAAGGLLLRDATPTAVIGLSALACMLAGTAALCSPTLRRLPARGTRESAVAGA